MQTFWRLGYEGASIAELTRAMGITVQSLYAAFGSKAALYRESLALYQGTVGRFASEALRSDGDTLVQIQGMLRQAAQEYSREDYPQGGCMVSTGILTCAAENEPEAAHVRHLRSNAIQAFRERLEEGIRKGDVREDADASALAHYIGAVIQGMSVQAQDRVGRAALAQIAELACGVLEPYRKSLSALHQG